MSSDSTTTATTTDSLIVRSVCLFSDNLHDFAALSAQLRECKTKLESAGFVVQTLRLCVPFQSCWHRMVELALSLPLDNDILVRFVFKNRFNLDRFRRS